MPTAHASPSVLQTSAPEAGTGAQAPFEARPEQQLAALVVAAPAWRHGCAAHLPPAHWSEQHSPAPVQAAPVSLQNSAVVHLLPAHTVEQHSAPPLQSAPTSPHVATGAAHFPLVHANPVQQSLVDAQSCVACLQVGAERHTPPSQVSVPQHWPMPAQPPFSTTHADDPPHVPPLHGSALQQSAPEVHAPPAAAQLGVTDPPHVPPLHGSALQQSDAAVQAPPDATHCVLVPPPFGAPELHATVSELRSATSCPTRRVSRRKQASQVSVQWHGRTLAGKFPCRDGHLGVRRGKE